MKLLKTLLLLLLPLSLLGQPGSGSGRYPLASSVLWSTTPCGQTWAETLDHWWSMDEASGPAIDLEGTNDGSVTGSPYGGTGKVDDAFDMNGSSEYITLGTGLTFGENDFTMTGWFYWDGSSVDIALMGSSNLNAFMLKVYSGGKVRAMIEGGGGTSLTDIAMSSGWNFISIVRTNSTDNFRYGINGSYEDETWDVNFSGATTFIGNNYDSEYWNNLIDEVNIWSAALTDTDTDYLYNSGSGRAYTDGPIDDCPEPPVPGTWTNLFVWYDMTETSGGYAYDSHTNNYDLTVSGTQTADGIVFNGTNNSAYNTTNLPIVGTSETFLIWVKPDGEFNNAILGGESGAFTLKLVTDYHLQAGLALGDSTTSTTLALTNDAWNFVSVVIEGSSIRFGVNGSYETETWTLTPTAETEYVGTSAYLGGVGYFKGTTKGYSWFTDAKCDEYITAFYNSGSGTDYEDGDPATCTEEQEFDILWQIDFEHYSVEAWETESEIETLFGDSLNQVTVNYTDLVEIVWDTIEGTTPTKALRIKNREDILYNGAGMTVVLPPYTTENGGEHTSDSAYQEMYVTWQFKQGYNWYHTHGGKLGGFQGVPDDPDMDPDPPRAGYGFRASVNWSYYQEYDYHYDQTFSWAPWSSLTDEEYMIDSVFVHPGDWHTIILRVMVNSGPTTEDGIYEMWIDGKMIVQLDDIHYYDNQGDIDTIGINAFDIEHYVGGNGADYIYWLEDVYGYFDNYTFYKDTADDYWGIRSLHSSGSTKFGPLGRVTNGEKFVYDQLITSGATFDSGTPDTCVIRQFTLDAGVSGTVDFDITSTDWSRDDYIVIYNGDTIGSPIIWSTHEIGYDDLAAEVPEFSSSGRYMHIVVSHKPNGGYWQLTGNLTWNSLGFLGLIFLLVRIRREE